MNIDNSIFLYTCIVSHLIYTYASFCRTQPHWVFGTTVVMHQRKTQNVDHQISVNEGTIEFGNRYQVYCPAGRS